MNLTELSCSNCGDALTGQFTPGQRIECNSCGSVFIAQDVEAPKTIICSQCNTINPINERYCNSCGQALKEDCVLCHTENPVGTVYCSNCGAHLKNARHRRQQMLTDRRKYREEQQQRFKEKEARQQAERLEQLLTDLDEPENHNYAIFKINQMGQKAITPLIETLLHDEDPDARYGSARALGQICSEHQIKALIKGRAVKALIKALQDPEPAVRYWSVNALGQCGNKRAVDPLLELLDDKHPGVQQQAEQVLLGIGGHNVEEVLAKRNKKGFFNWLKK